MILQKGNSKLGTKLIYTFSMRPGVAYTCPGESSECSKWCYAKKGFLGAMPAALNKQDQNYQLSKSDKFVKEIVAEIKNRKIKVVRIHVVGDFYDNDYINKWIEIIKECKETKFFAFTRSWNVANLRKTVVKLSKLSNLRMWWSVDRSMPQPKNIPKKTRLAYMQVEDKDCPSYKVDLIFRVKPIRKNIVKRVGQAIVCPVENGVTKTTCEQCGICWNEQIEKPGASPLTTAAKPQRLALPLLTAIVGNNGENLQNSGGKVPR